MKVYFDTECMRIITEDELKTAFNKLKADHPEEYNYNFSAYIRNCTDKNGTLETLETAMTASAMVLASWYSAKSEFPDEWADAMEAWNSLYKYDPGMGDRILKLFDLQ